ncbi:MAG: 23S rRNA (guanosine(2251)-2'-O)-methyltransferase RlmB [Candidatus Saganbacteria bacterium]|nr:23S rRNA (guanosine(2251)-2'-O)-methyltransferase RlmB [Candidatus Saganbacteria bacterium]
MTIESANNPRIKYVKSLGMAKARKKEKKFIVEGPHLVGEALNCFRESKKFPVDFMLYSADAPADILKTARDLGISCFSITEKVMGEISEVETPRGIIAVVSEEEFDLDDVLGGKPPLIVFCVDVQDPGNLGTIIRTADAVSASGVILSKGTVDLYNPKALRSTIGSIFHLPIVHVENIKETIMALKQSGIKIIAASLDAKKSYYDADLGGPVAIIFGNESKGLGRQIEVLCDGSVKIPMPGKAQSLNVGVSAAVILYEALRQRSKA